MNGLKFIRIQCNLSRSSIAKKIGVSRQLIGAWENGKKNIPEKRKEQLAKYFGIDKKYFESIDEKDKEKLIYMQMYRWNKNGEEFFLFRQNKESKDLYKGECHFYMLERKQLISDEVKKLKQVQRNMVNKINNQISGEPDYKLFDQKNSINRGMSYYKYCTEAYKAIYEQPSIEKMCYFYRALEVTKALTVAFGMEVSPFLDTSMYDKYNKEGDYTYRMDENFINECSELIINHMKPMIEKLKKYE